VVFIDEAGFYLLPMAVRTYAPVRQTPILSETLTRDHRSVIGAVTADGRLYLRGADRALSSKDVVRFLKHLQQHLGRKLLVIWDGSPIHRRAAVTDFLASPAGQEMVVEALPGYAPDLNPWDTGAWQHLKHVELRNISCLDLEELHLQLDLAIDRLRQQPALIQGFFQAAGLAL